MAQVATANALPEGLKREGVSAHDTAYLMSNPHALRESMHPCRCFPDSLEDAAGGGSWHAAGDFAEGAHQCT